MVPRSTCSLMNFCSSSSSTCDNRMFWLIRVAGAPVFSLMVWSHNHFGGNFFDSCSSNTRVCFWYCGGTKFFGSVVGVFVILPTIVWDVGLICRGRNRAFAVLGLRSTMGSWSCEIHPRAQLIFGCVAVNHGYPNMTRFSPRSDKKYRSVLWVVLVLVCRSV